MTASVPHEADGTYVVVAGEVITDLVPVGDKVYRAAPGGSPANVAVGLARLDVPTRMLARLSRDALGRGLRDHLESNGVDLRRAAVAAEPSSVAIVSLADDGSAHYDFHVTGTADWQWTEAEVETALDASDVALHVGSLAMTMRPGAEVLEGLVRRAHARQTVCFDPNIRPALMGDVDEVRPRVERLVSLSDVVKASAEDVTWLYPDRELEDVVKTWHDSGPALVAVTRGPDGVLAQGGGPVPIHRPGVAIAVVDTVGAGDSFMSALIAGLHRRQLLGAAARPRLAGLDDASLAAVLDEAIRASAITCMRPGADPPSAAELAAAG